MKKKETIRSLWTPTAGMLTGARRVAMLLLTTLLLSMISQTAWAQSPDDPDLGRIICDPDDFIGGSLAFYYSYDGESGSFFNQISIDGTTHMSDKLRSTDWQSMDYSSSNCIYIKGNPDATHVLSGYTITAKNANNEIVDVYYKENEVYYFVMPADGSDVIFTATFKGMFEKAKLGDEGHPHINFVTFDKTGKRQTVSTADLVDPVYVLDGSEKHLGQSGSETWYVAQKGINYTTAPTTIHDCSIILDGTVHLILADGADVNIDCEDEQGSSINGGDNSLTLYSQGNSASEGKFTIQTHGTLITESLSSFIVNGGVVNSLGRWCPFSANDVTIRGGKVTFSREDENSPAVYGNITILGGQVTVVGKIEGANITLGWTDATDFIKASSYEHHLDGWIKIADGQAMFDGTANYSGTLDNTQTAAIGGKTLVALVATVTSGSTTENYSVGDTYATPDAALKAAVENASNRSEVKLYADITAERCSLVVKKSMIIDLNGHSISVSSDHIFAVHVYEELTVKNGTLSNGSEALYVGRGVVVLENTTIRSTTPNEWCVSISDGTLTISKGLTLGGSIDNYQGTVQIADGQVLKYTDDGGQVQLLCGTLDADAINALANKDITFFGNAGGYCGQDNSETTDVDESKNVMWCISPDDPATADIDESKVLTISGTGAMANYSGQDMPWLDYKDDITTVVIENGVTCIGNKAFDSFTKLESVTIPASVTQIGDVAFYGCTNLATVSGASGVTKAHQSTIFAGTAWLNNLPDGLTYVGHVAYTFKGEGTSVELSDGTTQIAENAFAYSKITSISIPASVTFIGANAFAYSALTSVTIPASVTYIAENAFASSALEKIYSLATSAPTLVNNAFQGCHDLTDVIVPATAYDNHNYSSWSQGLQQGILKPGYTVTCDEGITTTAGPLVVEGETVTLAYSGTVPDGHTFVYTVKDADENDVTATVLSGTTLTMPGYNITVTGTTEIINFEIDGITYEWTNNQNVKVTGYNGTSSSLTIPPSVEHNGVSYDVTEIGERAFFNNSNLTAIDLTNCPIIVIGAHAFMGCTNLSEIYDLPASLTTIEEEAFSGCNLTKITIPEKVTSIGEGAFSDCTSLTSVTITIPASVTNISDDAFEGCSENLIIYVPEEMVESYSNLWPDANILAVGTIPYIAADGSTAYRKYGEYTVLTGSTSTVTLGSDGETTWYVVNDDVNYDNRINLVGNVNLILCDGMKMTCDGGSASAIVGSSSNLTIYGQTAGTGTLETYCGTGSAIVSNTLTINGGTVNAEGGNYFGISASGNVTINGGNVRARAIGNSGGIKAGGDIILGWTNNTDRIYASSFSAGGTISIANGKAFTDGTNDYTSATSSDDLKTALNKSVTLIPKKDIAACTATADNPMYHDGYNIGMFYDGTWNSNHGGIKVFDGETELTYYHYDANLDDFVGDYRTSVVSLDYPDDNPCTRVGEHCQLILTGENSWAGTLTIDIEIQPLTGNGTWGDNDELTWNYADGTLNINLADATGGNKAMKEADNYGKYPWYQYCSHITTISIGEGVTSIADNAFGSVSGIYTYNNVAKVTIPSTVTSIGADAFKGCISATDVYCYADPEKLTWSDTGDDFKSGDEKTTCHVADESAWSSFSSVNVAFVGDLAEKSIPYIDADGNMAYCTDFTVLDRTNTSPASGTYVVNSDITVNSRINLTGDTNLILTDDYTLDVKGIYIPEGSTLTIYAQSDGENAGRIVSHPTSGAAIGGMPDHSNGNIVIHGGNIKATGADNCAGIGSADSKTGGDITIYGGTVTAKGGADAAAIGGGQSCSGGTITIYGGTITANGPTDSETCENGAGIGGGDGGNGGTITINGGTITTYSRDGAGIGGGDEGEGGTITINGGTITSVKVNQGQGARIGGGCDGAPGTIIITGGTITTEGGSGAGIGGGKRNQANGTITINGGIIKASITSTSDGNNAINAGDVVINGGTVTATASGDAYAIFGNNVSILGGTVIANGTIYSENNSVTIAEGMIDCTLSGGTKRVITEGATADATTAAAVNTLLGGQEISISYSRTYTTGSGSGKASTLCLPFDFVANAADGTYATFTKVTETAGVYEVEMTAVADGATLTAGTPYMFLPKASGKLTQGNTAYTVPVDGFKAAGTETQGSWQFKGTFETKTWPSGQTHLYGFAGKDYYLSSGAQIAADDIGSFRRFDYGTCAAFRCYLLAPGASAARGVSKAGSLPETLKVKLVKADGTTTAIGTMDMRTGEVEFGEDWYDLNGRRLDSQPTQHGVYIYKGKKIKK